jgi:exopolyphosphatase/guanosine-5'-triphosphate,3'-diphosphate pyrophosphatase
VRLALSRNLEDLESLHQLRLSTKRLRYAMEIFAACFSVAFREQIYPQVEALQQKLGDVNDSHQVELRLERLARQIVDRKKHVSRSESVRELVTRLQQKQAAERASRHARFLSWCASFEKSGFFSSFQAELDSANAETVHPLPTSHAGQEQPGVAISNINRSASVSLDPKSAEAAQPRRIAAIDVGTNSIRLTVAEIANDGRYRILDDEKETTRLGRGLETTGEMAPEAMERSAQAIARMKKIADGYNVDVLRAVGTCAIREAANRDEFLTLVERQAGLSVEPIVAEAEAYLAHTSVAKAFDLRGLSVAVVDIGGGSTEVVLSSRGVVEQIYTVPLGAVRLTERFGGPEECAGPLYDDMRREIERVLDRETRGLPSSPQLIIGTGGTFTSLASISIARSQSGKPAGLVLSTGVRGYERNRSEVRHLLEWLRKMAGSERARVPGLSRERADIIVAGLTIVERVMRRLEVNRVQVHDGGIRDGLLRTIAATLFPQPNDGSAVDPMRSVRHFAAACAYEESHCLRVADLAVQIFDELAHCPASRPEKWAAAPNRLLLEAAAVLHDVGYFVNYSKHHQHSYHLIAHSDLAGFTRHDTELIANIARYHCRSEPKRRHPNYAKLSKGDRKLVRRMAAILRIAEGLDRAHTQNVRSISVRIEDDTAIFSLDAKEDPAVDIWGAEHKGRAFQKVFKLKPRFEWTGQSCEETLPLPSHKHVASS